MERAVKSWAIAIGVSVALHLGGVAMLGREVRAAPQPVRAPEKPAAKGEVVAFTPVSVIERPAAPPPPRLSPSPPRGRGSGRGEVKPAAPEPQLVDDSLGAPDSSNPHPDPLPKGEGEQKVVEVPNGSFVTEAVIVGPSPEIIALVHARLAAVAEGCYPPVARRYQQRGTVQLSFCTDAGGAAASSTVTLSSGAEVLDAAARGCVVERASPFPAAAASRCFSVPVRFGAR